MYCLSSPGLGRLAARRRYKMLFPLQGVLQLFLLSAVNHTSACAVVFSSEFAVEIHFTNILDFGKSAILPLLLALPVTIP